MSHKQHFLLSAKARTLSVRQVFELTDQQAFETFKEVRWGSGSAVTCPCCGVVDRHYFIRVRRQWRCKDCSHTFSVTSGTVFAFHKLPLKVYLAAIAIYTNAVKGISALQLGRDLGVQYKTAFVLAHKIRECLMEQRDEAPLSGEVQIDGAYVNGHIRPKNKKEDRIDRRLAIHQKPGKRCVLVFRQKAIPATLQAAISANDAQTEPTMTGANKTITFIVKGENQADIVSLADRVIKRGSIVCADENSAYDPLHARYDTRRVNHQVEYAADDGTTNNLAESYFARFRRMQYGQVHKFGNLYLANYANEAAYREDTRRWSNGKIFTDILTKCMRTRTHHDWCGYWQGNKRQAERLAT
ncbi:MAG: IS1595 family transposase [Rhodocyclaceae bacterium]|jgi:transposase-like protein|nr:IS1595 family transposase [Rhodocyclaceae bacterium]MCA3081046.1 IS1595 family transposase [Rhodocyclaceae bacterium]MCA3166947.1 IS1595 family transposase [Burkholderiales bacterium]